MSQTLRIGRYAFDSTQPVAELTTPWADGFEGESHPDHPLGLYALVLKHRLPARLDLMEAQTVNRIGIMQSVMQYEILKMGGISRLGFIMEKPPGQALMKDLKSPIKQMREDHLRLHLIGPMLETLTGLHDRALFHGSISPLRLFAKSEQSPLMLGEVVSLPPGFLQPAIFEPIERAQCEAACKGESTIEDDIFALGITTYMLAIGRNPFAEMTDDEIIRQRLEMGTTGFLLHHAKLQPAILEFVRGVCSDIPRQRWNFAEMEQWLHGHRVSLRATSHTAKASRSIHLNGKEFFRPRDLADELGKKPGEVRKLVESKELQRWLQRSASDHVLYDVTEEFLEKNPLTNITDEMLATQLAIILDPQGPIRYKGLRLMPRALGLALAQAYIEKNNNHQQLLAEIISSGLVAHWVKQPGNGISGSSSLGKTADSLKTYIGMQGIGYGLERAMYELENYAPCYSELFSRYYLISLQQLLPALDEIAGDGRRPSEPLDRHSAAFLAAKMGRSYDPILQGLNSGKSTASRSIAILNLLSILQSRYEMPPMPRLGAWLAETLKPAIDRFHSLTLRQTLQKNLSKLASQGELEKLQKAIDSPEVVEGDLRSFKHAAQQYRSLTMQIQEVNILLENKVTVGLAVGQRLAAAFCVALGLFAVAASILRAVQ